MKKTALVLVLAALLSGCGGSDSKGAAKSPSGGNAAPAATLSPEAGQATAMADVNQVAPKLQAYFAAHGYPADLAGVAKAMTDAGLFMDPSDALASYKLNPSNKQFTLCVQNDNGAWALFDTGSIGSHGKTGGCPQS